MLWCKFCLVYSCASASLGGGAPARQRLARGWRDASRTGTCRRRQLRLRLRRASSWCSHGSRSRSGGGSSSASAPPVASRRGTQLQAAAAMPRQRPLLRLPPDSKRDAARAPAIGRVFRKSRTRGAERDAPHPSAARAIGHRPCTAAEPPGGSDRAAAAAPSCSSSSSARSSASSAAVSAVASSKVVCMATAGGFESLQPPRAARGRSARPAISIGIARARPSRAMTEAKRVLVLDCGSITNPAPADMAALRQRGRGHHEE